MYGSTTSLGLALQNSWGTANVSSLHWLPFRTEGIGLNIPPLIAEANEGIYDEGEHYAGPRSIDGDIAVEARPLSIGAVLAAMFGRPSTVTSGAVQTHTFLPQTSDYDTRYCAKIPVTILKNVDVGSSMQFSNLNATSFEMSINNGEFLMATVGFVGGNFQQIARVAPAIGAGKRYTWDQSSISMANSSTCDIEQITIAIDDALEAQHTLCGSAYPSRIKRTGKRVTNVSGTIKFDTQDEYQQFLSQSERLLTVNLRGETQIQSGYYNSIRVDVPLLRHTEFKPVAGGPGAITVNFTSKGVYSPTSGHAVKFTLVNTQVGY